MTLFYTVLLSCYTCSDSDILNDAEIVNLCARIPPGTSSERTPGDGGFRIIVDDDVYLQKYVSERMYRISIAGISDEHLFSSAYLVAVHYNSSNENITVGKFHLVDAGRLAFHIYCSHVVRTVDSLPKAEVYVMWTSPPVATGCVEFRYHHYGYYMLCYCCMFI